MFFFFFVTRRVCSGAVVSLCSPFKLEVSQARAGPTCQIRLRSLFTGVHTAGGNEVEYYFKKDNATFDASDLKPTVDKVEAEVACAAAGTYYVGVKVVKCPLCSLILDAKFDLGAVYKIANSYRFDIPDATVKGRYAWTRTGAATWWYVDFKTDVVGTPHFNIDKETISMGDNYEYFYGAEGTDFLSSTSTKTMVSVSAQNLVKIDSLPAGKWTFAVQIKSVVGDFTQFRFDYSWNSDTKSELASATCPKAICATRDNCVDCTDKNCNWCEVERKCSASSMCKGNDTAVAVKDKCFDIDAACKAIKDCGGCADKDGCVWVRMCIVSVSAVSFVIIFF
jgi:hypothetical protein